MGDPWPIHSLHATEDPPFRNLEQVELQENRAIRSSQAQNHRKTTELQIAANRYSQIECYGLPQKKQRVSTSTAVVYHTEKSFRLDWDEHNDPMDPRNMGRLRKWLIVSTISMTVLVM